jgi:hypothetical protein
MSNSTTLNVVIVALSSLGQPTILPVNVKQVSPTLYQYANCSSTNLTESYRETNQDYDSSQLVLGLAQKLVSNSQDMPTEFNQIINENFWDLV